MLPFGIAINLKHQKTPTAEINFLEYENSSSSNKKKTIVRVGTASQIEHLTPIP